MVLKPYFLRGFKTLFFHRKTDGRGQKQYEKIGFSAGHRPWPKPRPEPCPGPWQGPWPSTKAMAKALEGLIRPLKAEL